MIRQALQCHLLFGPGFTGLLVHLSIVDAHTTEDGKGLQNIHVGSISVSNQWLTTAILDINIAVSFSNLIVGHPKLLGLDAATSSLV